MKIKLASRLTTTHKQADIDQKTSLRFIRNIQQNCSFKILCSTIDAETSADVMTET